MDHEKVSVLHEHYKDSCSTAASFRTARDRFFYLILALLSIVLFDLYAPKDFSTIVSDFIQKKLDTTKAPDLRYVKSVIWFLLLGSTIRYCQVTILLERQYKYLHGIESLLSSEFPKPAFTREGEAYLTAYPAFSSWAHYLYSAVFPLWFGVLVVYRTLRELPCCARWSGLDWFDLIVGVAILVSLILFLAAFHGLPKRLKRTAESSQ